MKKGKEFLKVLGISTLAIGLFSAAFVGINTMAFAASTGAVEHLPAVAATVVVPSEQTPPQDFVEPDVTVIVNTPFFSAPSVNALSTQEAAIVGAQYIWEMFGTCIDGMFVTLWHSAHPSHTRSYWMGNVHEAAPEPPPDRDASIEERMRHQEAGIRQRPLFSFTIDAITGEWVDILHSFNSGAIPEEVRAALDALARDNASGMYELRTGGPPPENLDAYAQIAREHAARHFTHTEVVSVEFMGIGVSGFGLDESGNPIATARQLMFTVTDNTGRVAEVSFDEATGALFRVSTMHNDFVPGFRFEEYDGPSRG